MNAYIPAATLRRLFQRQLPLLAAASALALSACSSSSPNSGAPAASAKADSKKADRQGKQPGASASDPAPTNSVFSVADTSKDPFFPKAKKAVAQAAAAAAPSPLDVYAQLQSGFQGVISSGDQRIALINNVMLEPGRESEISIGAGNNSRVVTVHCREVSRDAVVLDVQGYAQPLKIAYLGQ